jgi:hypothetical protein
LPQDLHKGFRRVLLLEGSGDFVAGYHFCLKLQSGEKGRFLPVAMLGAGTRISPEAIPFLLGKELKIIPHEDEGGAGLKAEEGWRETLERAGLRGGTVTGLGRLRCKDRRVVKDLNDCTEICLEDKPELEGLLK